VLDAGKIAAILSDVLGRPIVADELDVAQWEARMRATGMPEHSVTTLGIMFRYYARHGFTGNPHILAWLLGRPPATFAQFVGRVKGEG